MQSFEDIILRLTIQVPGFLLALVVHEAAHAYTADKFGDPTAKLAGRLTLNPIPHIDPIGTILFPLLGAMFGGLMFGWARPVPILTRYLKQARKAIFWISFSGPLSNIILAVICAFLTAIMATKVSTDFVFYNHFFNVLRSAVDINLILAAFNLIPFPPLDGSKMVSTFLSYNALVAYENLARYSLVFFLILIFTNVLHYILMPAIIFGRTLTALFASMLM